MPFDLSARRSGIVLHLTSLPGPHGLGDLGDEAHRFVDWLAASGQSLWQVLPIHPVGPGNSPYQCPSAFAGSPWLVALAPLATAPAFDAAQADYERAIPWRWAMLRQAAAGFEVRGKPAERQRFEAWCAAAADWLDGWCLYAALKDAHHGQPWWAWGEPLARRDAAALRAARATHAEAMRVHAFVQWVFDEQLQALRGYAHSRGVFLMGDVPIFVAHDSADVWLRPELYFMDERHELTVVAGVPPDGFGPDGQRWGNPLYRWERMAEDGYAWWVARLKRALAQADLVRVDHFRGFAGYWEVPAHCPTAREGRWAPGPGAALFEACRAALGPSWPKTWAPSRSTSSSCVTASACPACASCRRPSAAGAMVRRPPTRCTPSCRTTTCRTPWPTAARTTATPRAAGGTTPAPRCAPSRPSTWPATTPRASTGR